MGRTVRFDQVYVATLDADPLEQDVLTGVRSIITGEIEADEIVLNRLGIANTNPTTNLSVGTDLFMNNGQEIILDVKRSIQTERLFVNDKVGFGTTNPTKTLQIVKSGVDQVIVDTNQGAENLFLVYGNAFASNSSTSNVFRVGGNKLVANSISSNILSVRGNTFSTNTQVGTHLLVGTENVGANCAVFRSGNVVVQDGFLKVYGGMNIYGNLSITEPPSYTSINNLVVSNAVIQMGTGNNGDYDTALLLRDNPDTSNLIFGYLQTTNDFKLGRTFGGPETQNFIMDTSNTVNLHIYGDLYTENKVGVKNTTPTYDFSVGSNLYINDAAAGTSANVLWSNGYSYLHGMRLGAGGLQIGSAVTVNPLGYENPLASIISVQGNIQAKGFRTTGDGDFNSGIANTSPTDTFSIGDKIFANINQSNVLTVRGTARMDRILTDSIQIQDFIEVEGDSGITSVANVIIQADTSGPDSTSNAVTIKAGPTTANVSYMEIFGASTSSSHQNIRFGTKNTERVRITSDGKVGFGTTNPTERITVGGNLKINGSNTMIFGNAWGTQGNTSMRMYSTPGSGENFIENLVASGKGLNIKVGTNATLGNAKMSILESGRVGVGTTQPQSLLQTSGGSVFINSNVVQNGGSINHQNVPLTVTNVSPIVITNNTFNVLRLAREGTSPYHGVRSTMKLGRFENVSGTSRTRLDIDLAHDSYSATDVNVMTLRSDGRVGIGTHTPESKLMVNTSGARNPNTNGILVTNLIDADINQDAIISTRVREDAGDAFSTYMVDNNGSYEGWSIGLDNRNNTRDLRITNNVFAVSNVEHTALFIDGSSRNIGIGTDAPRGVLEVNGKVVIGNELYFGGVSTDEYSNTFLTERVYDSDFGITELLIFKGNDALNSAGPDRIRSVAGEHIFQTYDNILGLNTTDIDNVIQGNSPANTVLSITPNGRVLIGGRSAVDEDSLGLSSSTKLYVEGGFEFAPGQKISTGGMDLYSTAGGVNIIDNLSGNKLSFRNDNSEYARFTESGLIGFGTVPQTNVHVYSALTTDLDMLKLQSPVSAVPGSSKKTGILLYTDDGFGGYIRGYRNKTTGGAGLILGASNNSVLNDGLYVTQSSNVGIGTSTAATKLHLYNSVQRIESSASNAIIQYKTIGGISNVLADTTGNVYIQPASANTFIIGDLDITGDIRLDGRIDLGSQAGINLGGVAPSTTLHVNGGIITNSDQVACKRYSNAITITSFNDKTIKFTFGPSSFYAKIVAILREYEDDVKNMSTMVMEVQGGTSDGSTSTLPIAIGTKNVFGSLNDYPWSSTVAVDATTLTITPNDVQAARSYKYDISIELMSSNGGKLESIKSDTFTHATFTY